MSDTRPTHLLLADYTGIVQEHGTQSWIAEHFKQCWPQIRDLAAVVDALWDALAPMREEYKRRKST